MSVLRRYDVTDMFYYEFGSGYELSAAKRRFEYVNRWLKANVDERAEVKYNQGNWHPSYTLKVPTKDDILMFILTFGTTKDTADSYISKHVSL